MNSHLSRIPEPYSSGTLAEEARGRLNLASLRAVVSKPGQKIKIAYLIGSLGLGGAEGQMLSLIQNLTRSEFEPHLTLFNLDTAERGKGIVDNVFSLEISSSGISNWTVKGWMAAKALNRFRRYLESVRPDVVHAFLPAACILGCPAAKLARVPVVIGSRRSLVNAYRNLSKAAAYADCRATRFMDFMVGNCEAVTQEIIEIDGVRADRALTIHNGVDTVRFHPAMERSWRSKMGWSGEHVVLGMVANFLPYKRHVDFVRAAAIIRADFPNARFVMAGQDRGTLPEVVAEIHTLNLSDAVTVVAGIKNPEELYAAIDVCVSTSSTEGFSNVLLEAMASGKPIIATDVGGTSEAVGEEAGLLIPANSPESLARVAGRLIGDTELRERMGKFARKRVEERFSIERMVAEYQALYMKALKSPTDDSEGSAGRPDDYPA